jgi:hypothetical protein
VTVSVAADRPVTTDVALAVALVTIACSRPRVLRPVVLSVGFWYTPLMNEYSTSRTICFSICSICQSSSLPSGFGSALFDPFFCP